MRVALAQQLGGIGTVKLGELPDPVPAAGQAGAGPWRGCRPVGRRIPRRRLPGNCLAVRPRPGSRRRGRSGRGGAGVQPASECMRACSRRGAGSPNWRWRRRTVWPRCPAVRGPASLDPGHRRNADRCGCHRAAGGFRIRELPGRPAGGAQDPVDHMAGRRVGQRGHLSPGQQHRRSPGLPLAGVGRRPVRGGAVRPIGRHHAIPAQPAARRAPAAGKWLTRSPSPARSVSRTLVPAGVYRQPNRSP